MDSWQVKHANCSGQSLNQTFSMIRKQLINLGHKRQHGLVDNHKIISLDLIYACAFGVLVSNIDLNFQGILTHELTACPPVLINDNGEYEWD